MEIRQGLWGRAGRFQREKHNHSSDRERNHSTQASLSDIAGQMWVHTGKEGRGRIDEVKKCSQPFSRRCTPDSTQYYNRVAQSKHDLASSDAGPVSCHTSFAKVCWSAFPSSPAGDAYTGSFYYQ